MVERPTIQPGKRLSYTKRPFLGWRVNYLIALFNAMVNLTVKVVSQVGTTGTNPSALNNIRPGFSFDANGNAVLTIPITQADQSTQGWFWNAGSRNYNPASSYVEQQLVYVQASSAAVTTGLLDAGTLSNKKSIAGIWVCLQATAPTVISGTTYYNVPRLPMPTPDDMDDGANYWAFVSQVPQCV